MEKIYEILPKYFKKQCTDEEAKTVEQWGKENSTEFKEHQSIWELSENHEYIEFDSKEAWNELQPLLKTTKASDDKSSQTETKVIKMAGWKKFTAAAAVILVCGLGIMNLMGPSGNEGDLFADGINQEFTATTTRGQEIVTQRAVKETSLKNGDKIWLNKNTKVEDMGEKEGAYAVKVHQGEAFFDVKSRKGAHDEPFMVHTKNAAVSVIGTEFSVSSKKDKTIIRVVEGVVKIIANKKEITLKAGEQAYVVDGEIEKKDSFSPNNLAWKTGRFEFDNTAIQTVALLLETFYEVKIEVEQGAVGHTTGNFNVMDITPMLNSIVLPSGLKLEVVKENQHYRIKQ